MGFFDDEDSDDDEDSFQEQPDDVQEPEKLIERADGDIELKHLTETGGRIQSWLYDDPIIEYLDKEEQPEYIFTDVNNGLQYRYPDGTEGEFDGNSASGAYFLMITDRRIFYVAGSKGGDTTLEWDYESIEAVDSDSGWVTTKLNFTNTDGVDHAFNVTAETVQKEEAMEYIRQKIGKETSDEKYLSDISTSDEPKVSGVNPEVSKAGDDMQQWEYLTYRLDDSQHLDIVEAGFGDRLTAGSSEYPLPPDEVLNQLGEQGWKLVETVEKTGREFGKLASNEGSMTYAYIFRRPVSYESEPDEEGHESDDN